MQNDDDLLELAKQRFVDLLNLYNTDGILPPGEKMSERVIKYNQKSSREFGWDPSWFGCKSFDYELISKIKIFQKEKGLLVDGMLGPLSFRRIEAERLSEMPFDEPKKRQRRSEQYIVCNGKRIPIKWRKVVRWDEPNGLQCVPKSYVDMSGKPDRKPNFFVNHWDATLSSSACARIIKKRKLSVHFCIDNDGTIYQLLDTQDIAYQAGKRLWNHKSIGVEISNAFYRKYQSWYKKNGFGERPIMRSEFVHGRKVETHLGFYDVQLDALAALWEAISRGCDIPLEVPQGAKEVKEDCSKAKFDGFINHYHLTRRKIDCASLDMDDIIDKARRL